LVVDKILHRSVYGSPCTALARRQVHLLISDHNVENAAGRLVAYDDQVFGPMGIPNEIANFMASHNRQRRTAINTLRNEEARKVLAI